MGKVKQMGLEEAELLIDKTIESIKKGITTEYEALETLKKDELVKSFFSEDDLDIMFEFELDLFRDVDMAINEDEIIH